MLNKEYIQLFLSFFFFLIVSLFSLFIYISWDKSIDEDLASVEINLPIISWEKYLNLSKQTD